MCGIAGVLQFDGGPVPADELAQMSRCLEHRGPDGEGSYQAPGIGFGFTRLRIIDLSEASDQPFIDESGRVALVFNGEIYNYIELRAELRALGHQFRSAGDAEVILRSYLEWGSRCVQRFNGMFAFAIWDGREQRLMLSRDRFGEKPLYIARTGSQLLFASEMKAILAVRPGLRSPNRQSIFRYLSRGDLDLDSSTFFEGIESVPPAHSLLIERGGRETLERYWCPASSEVPAARGDAVERFRELLFDAVRIRLRSDVPVGSSLSGGLDSSSIVATINAQNGNREVHQRTFSARFHSATHDEGRFIGRVAADVNADSHEVWVEPDAFAEGFAALQWHQEEPVASASPFAQFAVMRLARENGTTVLLDGQGADEMLAGYDQAHGMFWAHWLRRGRPDRFAREVGGFMRRYRGGLGAPALFATYYLLPNGIRDTLAERYYRSNTIISPDLHAEFAPAHVDSPEPFPDRLRNELVRWQTTTQLPEFLRYADRNSMAFGREVRLPYLDHRLAEYCFGLPNDLLLHGAVTKVVLREAMRGIVADEIIDRKDKLAYAPPQAEWLRGALHGWIEKLLAAAEHRSEFFDPAGVRSVAARLNGEHGDTLAWRIASLEAWLQQFIDTTPKAVPAEHSAAR